MKYKELGKTGEKISVIGLGAWQAGLKSWGKDYTLEDVLKALETGIEMGINLIDTAEIYGNGRSESVIGSLVAEYRDRVFIATKVAGYNATPRGVWKAAERSRRRLKVEVIDLYQVHWPPSIYTSIPKLAREMERLVDKGVIRYIGLSNFGLKNMMRFREALRRHDIVSNQLQYNLLYRVVEKEIYPYMMSEKIELIAWSPIAKGALAGKTKADNIARRMDAVFDRARRANNLLNLLREIAEKHRCKMHQVALAWLISKGAIPIPGVKRPSQAKENVEAANITLTKTEIEQLDRASEKFTEGSLGELMPRIIPNWLQKIAIILMGGV